MRPPSRPSARGTRGVGLEPGQVVLLLQPRVAHEPRRAHAEAAQPPRRDGIRHEHARGQPAVERVLQGGELVVEHGRVRDAQDAARHRQVGRAVRERHVEAAARGRSAVIAATRPAAARALPAREPPPWCPITVCSIPWSSSSSSVWANARAVTETSQPRSRRRRTSGAKMTAWGELVRSIQTRTSGAPAQAAASDAARTAATTSRWAASSSVGNIGSASPSSAARSVSGRSPRR